MADEQANNKQTAVLRTEKMIGRQLLLDLATQAVVNNTECHILFFSGEGGIGKTRLLQEIGKAVSPMPLDGKDSVRWSDIIDLYHPETHSNSGIERALVDQLDSDNEYFAAYRDKRRQFEQNRLAGLTGEELESLRQTLKESFLAGYKRMAQAHRIVLTFDTLELVQYESDTIQELCEVREEILSVKNWFLDMLPQLPNSVTIFAGRPHQRLQADFQHHFTNGPCNYQTQPIQRLTEQEAKIYLGELTTKQAEIGKALQPGLFNQVYQAAEQGRPIYISLIADLLSEEFGTKLSDIFPVQDVSFNDAQMKQMKGQIARRLVNLPGLYGDIVRFLAYARQGLTISLLRELTQGAWSENGMKEAFETLRRFTFVKVSPRHKNRLYLHDEVYDLLNDYILINREDTDPIFRQIRDYYRAQRLSLQQKVEQVSHLPESQQAEAREILIYRLENITVRLLYYELHVDPLHAYYRYYTRWADEAIEGRRFGYDMRLRDVLLTFLKSLELNEEDAKSSSASPKPNHLRWEWLVQRTPIEDSKRDGAILWVRRYLTRDNFDQALRVAEKLRNSHEDLFNWDEIKDPFYKAALLVAWGEALVFTGAPHDKTLAKLHEVKQWVGAESTFTDALKDESWRRIRLLGRAEMDIGYLYRLQFRLSTAVTHYQKTITLYRQVDILSEMATVVNNLAFVFGLLGALDEAEALANDAIDIWFRLGRHYNEALSRNTRGRVALFADEPHRARAYCEQALTLLSEAEMAGANRRALGRVYLARGEVYRRLANLHDLRVYDEAAAQEFFVNGRNNLQDAEELFLALDNQNILETYAELGRLYRDWMQLLQRMDQKQEARERQKQAENYFEKALQAARQQQATHKEADILQDIGALSWNSGQARKAAKAIEDAKALIPKEYKPQSGTGFSDVSEPVNPYWEILGKLYLLEAQMRFSDKSTGSTSADTHVEEGLAFTIRAVAAFQQYNAFAGGPNPKMKQTKALIYHHLKGRKADDLKQLLKNAAMVVKNFGFKNMAWLFKYMERTLGV